MPGAVFHLERAGVAYQKAYGNYAYEEGAAAMTPATLFDAASLTKIVATAPSVLLLAEEGREWGLGSALAVSMSVLCVLSLVSFVAWERRMGEAAILPLRVFSSSVFSLTSVTAVLVGAGMFGGLVILPLYLQIVRGASPTAAGLQMIPLMVGIFLTSALSGKYMSRTGRYKRLPNVGTALMFSALVAMSTLGVDTPLWRADPGRLLGLPSTFCCS
jgi:hypothetical protein